MNSRVLLLFLSALLVLPAHAQKEHAIDLALTACLSNSSSTLSMLECVSVAGSKWNDELNSVYKSLASKLDSEGRQKLHQSQEQWIKYRDAEFTLIAGLYDAPKFEGTLFRPIEAEEKVKLTKRRVLELKDYLDTIEFEMP